MRSSPSESSEMISQLIFGDIITRIQQENNWSLIRHEFDGYEGWVDSKMLTPIGEFLDEADLEWKWVHQAHLIFRDGSKQGLPSGSRVPFLRGTGQVWHPVERDCKLSKGAILFDFSAGVPPIHQIAETFLHVPYMWGGCSGFGIDCSGLTQRVFRMAGRLIPRDSRPQEKVGKDISWGERQAGDLAFFSKPKQDKITHVGIFKNRDEIIHASGRVRIDPISILGIIHHKDFYLTHQLISIKR